MRGVWLGVLAAMVLVGCDKEEAKSSEGEKSEEKAAPEKKAEDKAPAEKPAAEQAKAPATPCGQLAKRLTECVDGYSDVAEVTGRCEKGDEMVAPLLPCADKSECYEVKSCVREQMRNAKDKAGNARMAERLKGMQAQVDAKDFKAAAETCKRYSTDTDKAFIALCRTVATGRVAQLTTELTKKRDDFGTDDHWKVCSEFTRMGESLGSEVEAKARMLCAELDVARKIGKVAADAEEALKKGRSRPAFGCKSATEELEKLESPWKATGTTKLETYCGAGFSKKAYTVLLERWKSVRDDTTKTIDILGCSNLERAAKEVGEAEAAIAATHCHEMKGERDAREAIKEAKKNAAASLNEIPFKCKFSIEKLAKAESDWAKSRIQAVGKACYVELGKKVLDAKVPKMGRFCEWHVQQIYRITTAHGIKDPSIDPIIEKLARRCK